MESDGMTTDRTAAAAQLAALQADREAMARRVVPPWWYDPALGGIVFVLFASASLRHAGWWWLLADVVALAGAWAVVTGYKRVTGVWVSGTRKGRTQRAIAAWMVLYLVVVGLAGAAEFGLGWRGAMAVGGAVLGVGVVLVGRWWTHLYVAELLEQV